MKKPTQCIHSGSYRDQTTRGVNTPIFTSSSYEYMDRDDTPYPRYFNTPNQDAVIKKVCALEHAEDGVIFSSGMAAVSTAILAFVESGSHVVVQDEIYGGTHTLAGGLFHKHGIDHSFSGTSAEMIIDAAGDNTKVMVIESPTNPLLTVIDIRKVAGFAKENGIVTIMDNTFASPINQNPIDLGIDVVVHSGTKYLGGHSDLCCGVAVSSKEKTARIRSLARLLGGSLNAQTCYLLERSLKTLFIRIQRQTLNAMHLAEFLDGHKSVKNVYYPGLKHMPGYEIATSQMKGFGAMLSFELDGLNAGEFTRRLKLITPAVSLGGVETLICSPAMTSHSTMSEKDRQRVGITDRLLRLSVGAEDVTDLEDDLRNALEG